MSVQILTEMSKGSVFVCTTSDTAFGPLMQAGTAEEFLEWLNADPREYSTDELCDRYNNFMFDRQITLCDVCGMKHVGGTASHDKATGLYI